MRRLDLNNLPSENPDSNINNVLVEIQKAVLASQRCIVITGAGISVSSGIPDFRSPDGLFQQLKKRYPNTLSNGKDLFDANRFADPSMVNLFYNFMGELRHLVSKADCTPTHSFIKELDEQGKLLRCYTQNIDSLEKRVGLETSFQRPPAPIEVVDDEEETVTPPKSYCTPPEPPVVKNNTNKPMGRQRRKRQTTLDKTFTRAVQLHGDLENVICTICHTRYPFTPELAKEFCQGSPPACPRCKEIEALRDMVGKRSVASGVLRPDIVLYNEFHPKEELIGTLSQYDIRRRPDLLIVMGTSLKIPGVKRMVREMSRCVHDTTLKSKRAGAGKAIFINRDEPPKGWESVFDYFVAGDSDRAVELLPTKETGESADHQATETSTAPKSAVVDIDATEKKGRRWCDKPLSALLPTQKKQTPPRNKLTSMLRVVKTTTVSSVSKRKRTTKPSTSATATKNNNISSEAPPRSPIMTSST